MGTYMHDHQVSIHIQLLSWMKEEFNVAVTMMTNQFQSTSSFKLDESQH
jgi:hypothetical protein